jgi:hypothetical protein
VFFFFSLLSHSVVLSAQQNLPKLCAVTKALRQRQRYHDTRLVLLFSTSWCFFFVCVLCCYYDVSLFLLLLLSLFVPLFYYYYYHFLLLTLLQPIDVKQRRHACCPSFSFLLVLLFITTICLQFLSMEYKKFASPISPCSKVSLALVVCLFPLGFVYVVCVLLCVASLVALLTATILSFFSD